MTDKHLLDLPPDRLVGEVAVALFFEEDRPLVGAAALLDWRLNGHLTRQIIADSVTGSLRDCVLVQNNGKLVSNWAMLVGGGQRKKLSMTVWSRLIAQVFTTCSHAGFSRIALCLDTDGSIAKNELAALVSEVYTTGRYTGIDYVLSLVPLKADSD